MIGRTALKVLYVHLGLLSLVFIFSWIKGCDFRKKKPEPKPLATFVTIESAPSIRPQMQEVAEIKMPEPAAPAPVTAPVPTPAPPKPAVIPEKPKVTPKVEPKVKPKPVKKKWKPAPVVRQDTKVRNPAVKPRAPKKINLNDLKKELDAAFPTVSAPASSAMPSEYGQIIQSRMYAAWQQPSVAAGTNRGAVVRIRIERNGTISSAVLETSSGNKQIDSTAVRAARSVRLPDLPANMKSSVSVTVEFKLTA